MRTSEIYRIEPEKVVDALEDLAGCFIDFEFRM